MRVPLRMSLPPQMRVSTARYFPISIRAMTNHLSFFQAVKINLHFRAAVLIFSSTQVSLLRVTDLTAQPSAGHAPLALDCGARNAECLRRLLNRQTAEIAQ